MRGHAATAAPSLSYSPGEIRTHKSRRFHQPSPPASSAQRYSWTPPIQAAGDYYAGAGIEPARATYEDADLPLIYPAAIAFNTSSIFVSRSPLDLPPTTLIFSSGAIKIKVGMLRTLYCLANSG